MSTEVKYVVAHVRDVQPDDLSVAVFGIGSGALEMNKIGADLNAGITFERNYTWCEAREARNRNYADPAAWCVIKRRGRNEYGEICP